MLRTIDFVQMHCRVLPPLTIFYCGADHPWRELQRIGFSRRNTCLLEAFTGAQRVERVIVVNYVLRPRLLPAIIHGLRGRDEGSKALDIFVTSVLPERWTWFPLQALNRWLTRLQIGAQGGGFQQQKMVTWCYWPDGYRIARRLQLPGLLVFDADHDILRDENRAAGNRGELPGLMEECAQRVDLIVGGARSILGWFSERGARNVFRLRNGVDLSRFPLVTSREQNRRPPLPLIGYVGTLSPWIDYDLLLELAEKRPNWTFRLIGSPYKGAGLAPLPNVELVGSRTAKESTGELRLFDVALGLYRKEEWLDVDSMKFFEYLAADVPIVSTPFHPYLNEDFDGLIELAPDANAFVNAIERILAWSEPMRREWDRRREEFIARNTWAGRAEEAIDELLRLPSSN